MKKVGENRYYTITILNNFVDNFCHFIFKSIDVAEITSLINYINEKIMKYQLNLINIFLNYGKLRFNKCYNVKYCMFLLYFR